MREDEAIEADLVRAGYRDRLLTELVQNAADAAAAANVAGRVHVWLDGGDLHVANTGSPLSAEGVQALSAMRASGKQPSVDSVGRFGVGFTAVLSVGDEIEMRSTSGSICFSARSTRAELQGNGISVVDTVPVLRLAWPTGTSPAAGFDTEVVVRLRPGLDARALLVAMQAEAVDLLLELPALQSIRIGEGECARTVEALPGGLEDVRIAQHRWWQYRLADRRWLVPVVAGEVAPVAEDVLRAPTRSDEGLSLPAILICDIPMQPDRRRVLPGGPIAELASGYSDFVRSLPATERHKLIPAPGFARSEVDRVLREALLAELRAGSWLPVVGVAASAKPTRATVLPGLTAELATLLEDVVPALVVPELSGQETASAFAQVDVHRLGLARLAEMLSGIERSPVWWRDLYDALEPLVIDAVAVEELGALPVPLADGRTVTGPRTAVTAVDLVWSGNGSDAMLPVHWARLVHPGAVHPLLGRLGSRQVGAADLLLDPELRAVIDNVEDEDADDLAGAVLTLAGGVSDPSILPSWLGLLLLPDEDGELRHADELLLPDAPLRAVLLPETPFGTVDSALAERFGTTALRAVGVGWTFQIVRDDLPTGPDHELDDEDNWWSDLPDDPEALVAVRDLDLVDPAKWHDALTLLVADSTIAPALADRRGYIAWWLRTHAVLDGQRLGTLRSATDNTFEGLLDVVEHPRAPALQSCLASADDVDLDLIHVLIDRLADPERLPTPAVVVDTHRRLALCMAAGVVDPDSISLPDRVRTVAATLADPADVVVLDQPWFALAIPPDRLVAGDIATAPSLAELLDLPLASETIRGEVMGVGRASTWDAEPSLVLASIGLGVALSTGPVVVHDTLTVRLSGSVEATVDVALWVADDGVTHVAAMSP